MEDFTASYGMKIDKLLFRTGLKKFLGIFKVVHDRVIQDLRDVYYS